jgi:hypothetical protein
MKRSGIRVKLRKGLPDNAALQPGNTTVLLHQQDDKNPAPK